jgi:hypothetical protein
MERHNELPLFMLDIDEDMDSELEVNQTALVDRPAIQRDFQYFNNRERFKIQEDRRIVSGPLMIPDMPIYRFDAQVGEYYVQFSKETVLKIARKWFAKGFQNNFNLMHDSEQPTPVVMFESMIKDSSRGSLGLAGYEDLPDGTWFGSVFVIDDEVWSKVKSGEFKGFSVEGMFKPTRTEAEKIAAIEQLLRAEGFK